MHGRVYQRDGKWIAEWQARRRFDSREEAERAAALPLPPPPENERRVPADLRELLRHLHRRGLDAETLARALTEAGILTPRGRAEWRACSVAGIVRRAERTRDDEARHSEWHL